ncbi:hypothetical protein D5S18_14925 [Nocardia panacis]|uniref:Uncharacterized protein n=1 Tax=Nocardia panacis TaxID=2340916 RepID=A0A3A4KNP5_9NOCA|nr:hypothetical protein D5S18_14925 [Nocardia panacis]
MGRAQLDGLVVLYTYLQRISVYDRVIDGLGAGRRDDGWSGPLGEVGAIIGRFDRGTRLDAAEVAHLLDILDTVRAAMRRRRPDPDASLPERLAVVAGDLHGGLHHSEGVVRWGEIYDAAAARRHRQRAVAHRGLVNTVNEYVARAGAGGVLGAEELARIDAWFTKVCTGSPGIERDLRRAGEALRGQGGGRSVC